MKEVRRKEYKCEEVPDVGDMRRLKRYLEKVLTHSPCVCEISINELFSILVPQIYSKCQLKDLLCKAIKWIFQGLLCVMGRQLNLDKIVSSL